METIKKKVPICPYTREKCIRFDFVRQCGLCQSHANNYSSVRCGKLPKWVKDGFHIAALRGEGLHV